MHTRSIYSADSFAMHMLFISIQFLYFRSADDTILTLCFLGVLLFSKVMFNIAYDVIENATNVDRRIGEIIEPDCREKK